MRIVFLISIIFCIGCSPITASFKNNKMTLSGYGAKSAEWYQDGSPKSIGRHEPFEVPDIQFDN